MLKKLFQRKKTAVPIGVLPGYAHWARNYPARAHNALMEIEQEAMVSLFPDLKGKVCLDLACGSGRYMILLETGRPRQVVGIDYSAHMLASAKKTGAHFELARSPFRALPFAPQTFDLITCGLAVGHEKNLDQTLAEAARVLRPGGAIIYSDLHPFGALSGWQRSFTAAGGGVFTLEHYIHLYSHHHRACRAARLTIDAILEPQAGEQAPPAHRHFPAVLVIRALKTGSAHV